MKNFDPYDEKIIFSQLSTLINGLDCSKQSLEQHKEQEGIVYVKDKESIQSSSTDKKISFTGKILNGGILQQDGSYLSDDREFIYSLDTSSGAGILHITSMCKKTSFTLINFSQKNCDFGIYLREKPYKELGFVYCNTFSVHPYIKAFKEIAPYIAKRIYKAGYLTKAVVNDYKSEKINVLGPFYDDKNFTKSVQNIPMNLENLYLLNYAMIESMRYFTKDNGLAKELYIFSGNPTPLDKFRADLVVKTMKNLNHNITQGRQEQAINQVVFHSFALGEEVAFLQKLSEDSGGKYYQVNSTLEFKRALLSHLDNGKMPDPKELGDDAKILPITPEKIHDDNPPY
ncbi:hypothetical protein CUPS4064_05910 [Campylobacter upsaliensis]|uniref:hypothetical protein n=1 Tax=Campylobacter upsaliensis TaxID=28080 RepID=UPI002149A913|nr:hypothetical protein [Campylobacter upsaliensis]MCR2113675.1 hypothetical protein [Campylobacter upsaliensis]